MKGSAMSRTKFVPSETKRPASVTIEHAAIRDDKAVIIVVTAITVTTNPRSHIGDLNELKESIKINGILNPLLVAKTHDGFQLLGGHRRLRCAQDLGLTHVPCRIVVTEEPDVVKLLDNIMREDLDPEDLCLSLKRLLTNFGGNKSALARAVSKSPSYVNRAVKAAELIEAGLFTREQRPLSLRALFELAMSENPRAALETAAEDNGDAVSQTKAGNSSQPRRQSSGALPGGRAIAQALKLRMTKGGSFNLRINFHPEQTPTASREEIVKTLETLLARLRGIST
jgi:ParB/RepB/Spo0J family partition protein